MQEVNPTEVAVADIASAIATLAPVVEILNRAANHWRDKRFPLPANENVTYNEVGSTDYTCEQTFRRYMHYYPQLKNEWIPTTLQQICVTTAEGLAAHFREKLVLLRRCAFIVRALAQPTPETNNSNTLRFLNDILSFSEPYAKAHIMNINISDSQNVQIGTGHTQENLNLTISDIIERIEKSTAKEAEKTEAKTLLKSFLENPIVAAVIGGLVTK